MKKVLIFSLQYYPTHVGGAEVAIKEITDRIPSEDIEFHMITNQFDASQPRRERVGNIIVHRIGWGKKGATVSDTFSPLFYLSKIFFIPLAALKGKMLHRREHFDGVWAMMTYMTFPIVLMRLMFVRIPYVITLQDGDPFEQVFDRWYIRPFKPLLLYGFRHATIVQTISTFLAGWAKHAGYSGKVEVIPNGVDIELFSQHVSGATVDAIARSLNKKFGDTFVITTSRLIHKNAVDTMIEALPLLPDNVHFVVLGIGPDEAKLKKLAADLGVRERVRFVGFIPHKEMPAYLQASDIFIRASRSEGMGASFVEAMASGLPVVATQEGGIADFLFDAKRNYGEPTTGWAVDKDNPQQIAEAIQDITAHPQTVREVTERAQKMMIEKYDWNLIAKNMHERVFDPLCESKRKTKFKSRH